MYASLGLNEFTYLGRDKTAAFSQTTLSNFQWANKSQIMAIHISMLHTVYKQSLYDMFVKTSIPQV